jgi:formiminotetrahydrofolate cyclodeaminase
MCIPRSLRKMVSTLTRCKKLSDDAMSAIAQLTCLQSLKLSECELITDDGETLQRSLDVCLPAAMMLGCKQASQGWM